nr:hypothetical protein BCV17_02345 [Vibrio cyclitrophicus]
MAASLVLRNHEKLSVVGSFRRGAQINRAILDGISLLNRQAKDLLSEPRLSIIFHKQFQLVLVK